jgi:3-deoxy-D-manno-octulosonic-acid transferase
LALPLIFLRLFIRSLKVPSYRRRWLERFGIVAKQTPSGGVWIHAVSVGEVVAAVPLISALLASYPDLPLTITTTTPTGSQRLQQALGEKITHMYMPYDLSWALQDVFKKIRPKLIVLMETELWPNLLYKCQQQQIPVIIANGRISDRSLIGYHKIKVFVAHMLQQVTMVLAQSQQDGERFMQLGLDPTKLQVTGNLKFDVQVPIQQQQFGLALKGSLQNRQVWVAASTHLGEEIIILQSFQELRKKWPDLLLILVPRHPNRFDEVARILEQFNLTYVRRSNNVPCLHTTAVLLGDTMGELNIFYAAADFAFVGGSLVPVGGHNLLEPAAAGIGIMTGPQVSNFKEITDKLLENQAAVVVHNKPEIVEQVNNWLANPTQLQQCGANALQVIEANRGATGKVILKLSAYLGQSLGLA